MMQQHLILRYLRRPSRRFYHTSNDYAAAPSVVSSMNWVRDRGLDHAVEKERDLRPMILIKNLITSEPSKSLPISIISDKRSSLAIPTRPIDFIRKYPSVFHEFLPGNIGILPHVKLTPQVLTLDAQEQLLFQTQIHKQDVANRLLKLLMLSRINKIPLSVIDTLKWDLGLPNDYTQTIVPQFPDYFQLTSTGNELELVCWSDELAVSVMEKNKMTSFPLQYSRGFELDNKFKKWVDDWQQLPYISPYENASHLQAKSDESDKWSVSLLHEILHLLVPKKTQKDNLLFLGEYLGVRSRFKRALLQHPGIFYVSSKLNTHTVVLREAYKRDLLITKPRHPIMNLRSNYIHLMNMVIPGKKPNNAEVVGVKKQTITQDSKSDNEETSVGSSEDEEEDNIEDVTNSNSDSEKTNISDSENENENMNIRRRTNRSVTFNDSPRRNTPNSRGSENDGRRRGRGRNGKNNYNEKIDSDKRGARNTNRVGFLKTEDPGARKARVRSSRTKEGRF